MLFCRSASCDAFGTAAKQAIGQLTQNFLDVSTLVTARRWSDRNIFPLRQTVNVRKGNLLFFNLQTILKIKIRFNLQCVELLDGSPKFPRR